MTLQQLFDQINKKSNFYRDEDEVWDAISTAAKELYLEILKESQRGQQSGFFLTWDTTTITLQANVEEYALPVQLSALVRVRERLLATDPWRVVEPADLNDNSFVDAQFSATIGADQTGPVSDFEYTGPYLLMADAQTAARPLHLRIAPLPQDTRFVELVYTAKFVEITGPESPLIIPDEGHTLIKAMAIGELLGAEDDDNPYWEGQVERLRPLFFNWVRNRQVQKSRTQEAYIEDLD